MNTAYDAACGNLKYNLARMDLDCDVCGSLVLFAAILCAPCYTVVPGQLRERCGSLPTPDGRDLKRVARKWTDLGVLRSDSDNRVSLAVDVQAIRYGIHLCHARLKPFGYWPTHPPCGTPTDIFTCPCCGQYPGHTANTTTTTPPPGGTNR